METKFWKVDKDVDISQSYPQITQAAQLLRNNEILAFPTETVYGLGGNAKTDEAIEKIFAAKGRPSDNPLIIHIGRIEQIHEFVTCIPSKAAILMKKFWPGPLTIIFSKKEGVISDRATPNMSTVAVRMPDHPLALALINEAGLPIAAPSANRSGKPSPTTAAHVWEDLQGRIAGVVDGGSTGVGLESTVIDCTGEVPILLRPGAVTKEQIEAVIGEIKVDNALADQVVAPKSPGMKYTHYAPNAPLYLVKGSHEQMQQHINRLRKDGLRVGVLTTDENLDVYDADIVCSCGRRTELATVASGLYEALRSFNLADADVILSEMFHDEGIGLAIMNRLFKAAGYKVLE